MSVTLALAHLRADRLHRAMHRPPLGAVVANNNNNRRTSVGPNAPAHKRQDKPREWSTLRQPQQPAAAPPPSVASVAEDSVIHWAKAPVAVTSPPGLSRTKAATVDDDSCLYELLSSPVDSEFLETPAAGGVASKKKAALQAEKAWVEAEKAKLETARALMEAEKAKLETERAKAHLEMEKEKAWLEMEKEKARMASERAQMAAEMAALETERARQDAERVRFEAERVAAASAAAEGEAKAPAPQQESFESYVPPAKTATPLGGDELLAAVKRLKADDPSLGPKTVHEALLDEGFAVDITAVRKAMKKVRPWCPHRRCPHALSLRALPDTPTVFFHACHPGNEIREAHRRRVHPLAGRSRDPSVPSLHRRIDPLRLQVRAPHHHRDPTTTGAL